jgi:pimeloyl-ACP methyl ester carboxylesterase
VLVPGAWLGGWAWQPVTRRLRAQGHDVHPITLTGLGERAHLASPEVDQDTHVADVIGVLETEDLRDVVLVGHSYAGTTVTGVAAQVPGRIGNLVYLDSGPVADGSAYLDQVPPEVAARARELVGDGWKLPMPSFEELAEVNQASLEGIDEATLERWRGKATAQPFGTYTSPLRRPAWPEGGPGFTRTLLSSSFPLDLVRKFIAEGHPWFAELAEPGWELAELPTGHWPMFSRPGDLADLLATLA